MIASNCLHTHTHSPSSSQEDGHLLRSHPDLHTERAWEARGYISISNAILCTGMQFAAYMSSTYLSWTYVITHTHSPTIAYTYTSSYSAVMLQPSYLKTISSSLSYNFKLGFKCSDFRLVMSNFLRVHDYTTFYWPVPRLFPPPALAVCNAVCILYPTKHWSLRRPENKAGVFTFFTLSHDKARSCTSACG